MKQTLVYIIGEFTFYIPLDEANDTPHAAMLGELFDTIANMTDEEVAEAIAEELEDGLLDEYGDPDEGGRPDEWSHYHGGEWRRDY